MSNSPGASPGAGANVSAAILAGGLIAGAMDITAAFVSSGLRGIPPVRVLQSVASGLLGRESYQGGAATAILGILLHFGIAFAWATLFVLLSRRFKVLIEKPWLTGPLYGVVVYLVMYRIVLPLSAFPHAGSGAWLKNVLIHVFCVGLPIALAARRWRG
ncbi:MAG TPA: hypothetical protein VF017_21040 [Thermoanaerobaculia bacterium]|nr:hypothetical protein [Thermoanaerobaculia bacterium]